MPIPMITLLSGGRSAVGKQNLIREVLLLPKPSLSLSKVRYLLYLIPYMLISCPINVESLTCIKSEE